MAAVGDEQRRSGFGRRRGRQRRRWQHVAAIAGGLGVLVVLALLGLPLWLRGPVLSALAGQQSKSLCGKVEIAGGHLSANAVLALIFQRPFDVALDGVLIREPEGDDLFRARTVRMRMAVLRKPWRVVVQRARIADGAWRLESQHEGELLIAAFERVPAAGRRACRLPAPPQEHQPPPPLGSLIRLESVTLQNVSLLLAFSDWAVSMNALDAHGTLEARGTPDGVQLLFDARDVRARRGGSLRIGPAGRPRTFAIPFDSVEVPRVAVTGAAPFDLQLVVAAARTRAARLSGEATFTDVLAPGSLNRPAGMILSTRWTDLGQALARDPPWAAVGRRMAALHAGARASLRGPFDALTGSAAVDGNGLSLRAGLLPHGRYTLDGDFRALDTRPWLARAQRAWLGGRLDGHVAVSAQLGPGPRDSSVTLDAVALTLQRDPSAADTVPRRWVIERAPSRSPPSLESSPEELRVALGTVTLERGEIVVDPFRVAAPGVAIAGSLRAARAKAPSVHARFVPGSRLTWRGETFRISPRLDVEGDATGDLTLTRFTVANVAGGTVGIEGSMHHDGAVDLRATVMRYPLAHLPGAARARVPGQSAPLGQLLGGELDADLHLRGSKRSPSLSGQLAVDDLRWAHQRIGDGAIQFDAIDGGTRFQGRLLSGVDVHGTFTQRTGASVHASLTLAQLQRALPALRLRRASGVVAADLEWPAGGAEAPSRIDASVSWARPLSIWPTRLPAAIELQPARIALHDGELGTTNMVARAAGVQVTIGGHVRIDGTDAGASPIAATIGVAADGRRLGAALGGGSRITGSGSANLNATLSGSLRAPRIQGQARFQALAVDWPGSPVGAIRLDGPLAVAGPLANGGAGPELVIGPLLARTASGGWILIAGARGPGRIQLAPERAPLRISDIDLLVRGAGLTTLHPIAGVSLKGLALALALRPRDRRAETLRLSGSVHVGHTVYRVGASHDKGAPPRSPPARHESVLDRIWADNVQIIGPRDAVEASVSYAPAVTVGLRCTINGPIAAPHVAGRVEGDGLYSRLALTIADWFTARDLHQCDFGPH